MVYEMKKMKWSWLVVVASVGGVCAQDEAERPKPRVEVEESGEDSGIKEVTLYQGTALVTREVVVPRGREGAFEVIVTGLPTATDAESVFADEAEGWRFDR